MEKKEKFSIKKHVTNLILEACEKEDKLPWDKGLLNADLVPMNPVTKNVYKGFNRLFLSWIGGINNPTYEFVTWNNLQEKKAKLNKGAKPLMVVFWKFRKWNKKENREYQDGDDKNDIISKPLLRYFNVYKISQTTLPPRKVEERPNASIEDIDDFINKFVERTEIKVEHKISGTAYYAPRSHSVSIAERKYYKSSEEFYSTFFHELVHSTMKEMKRNKSIIWGDHEYSKEEVVAETGAMFLCNYFGIEKTTRNSQAYLQGWSRKLRENPLWLISGANAAEKAVNYMLETAGLPPMSEPAKGDEDIADEDE